MGFISIFPHKSVYVFRNRFYHLAASYWLLFFFLWLLLSLINLKWKDNLLIVLTKIFLYMFYFCVLFLFSVWRYICLRTGAHIYWFSHRHKSQAMLLLEGEHYNLFTLSSKVKTSPLNRKTFSSSFHPYLTPLFFFPPSPFPLAFLHSLILLFIPS